MKKIHVSAGVLCRNGKILLCSRTGKKEAEEFWEFPGGKCEKGERVSECLKRELYEELSVKVTPGEILYKTETDRIVLWFIEASMAPDAVPLPREGQEIYWPEITPEPPPEILPNDKKFWIFLNNCTI